MNLSIVSWNGNSTINDNIHYQTGIVGGQMFNLTSQAVYADRAENFPYLSGMVLPPHSYIIRVLSKSNPSVSAAREALKGIFRVDDFQPHALIAQDTEDSNTQYQLVGFPAMLAVEQGDSGDQGADLTFLITIAVAEPVWQAVSAATDTWNPASSGATHTITLMKGNTISRPTIAVTPTANRTGQFLYSRWVPFYNRANVPLVNYSEDITNGGLNTSALVNFTGQSNQLNGAINNSVTVIPINTPVGGGLPTVGMGYVDTEQISWTGISGGSLQGVTRGIGGTTAASHLTGAVVALSKMLANGGDIAVQFDGNLINNWPSTVSAFSATAMKVWIAQNWSPGQTGNLRTALPNNGTAVTVQFANTTNGKAVLTALKTAPNGVFLIDNEAFTFSQGNVDIVNAQITNCQRAAKFTSFAAHSVGASVFWIEHDIWLLYGNSNGSGFTTDNTQQPLLDLVNSTNTSWVQTQFYDSGSNRPAAWTGQVTSSTGKQSVIFTGNQKALANPATELGMDLINYLQSSLWKAENASIYWLFSHPTGITTVSMSGSKYLFTLTNPAWPLVAGLQKATNINTWLTVWTEAIPTLANTWQSFTHSAVSLGGTYTSIRLALIGTIAAQPSNDAAIQGDTITLTLDNTKTPVVALNSENSSIYYLAMTLTNTTVSPNISIIVNYPMALNRTLTIDTAKKTITYDDGSNAIAALTLSGTRNDWFPLAPGANALQITDVGMASTTIVTTWKDRNL